MIDSHVEKPETIILAVVQAINAIQCLVRKSEPVDEGEKCTIDMDHMVTTICLISESMRRRRRSLHLYRNKEPPN